ncbi:probable splicing factor, arginine/serine-rich 6 [Galendromus occidentalis]|uniref:Probable splicing factor, arginine/serine-rich 6 n=1 Tax=Galendromus occidentalis TaxID=34638 RepID=A0AAJ7SJH1_9ACAR|nr:probable splicing factor, arginine/serine-rich 6 [Galendromus occidentalis]
MPRGIDSEDFKVYVGGLRYGVTERDIERMFDRYGTINRIFVARKPPGFAFVHFEREEDAEEAVRKCDGREIRGHRIRVELSHGKHTNRKHWWRSNPVLLSLCSLGMIRAPSTSLELDSLLADLRVSTFLG